MFTRLIPALLIGLAMLLPARDGMASDTGTIRGRVIDAETGEALPGVNVIVVGRSSGAATDQDGLYRIVLVPGEYTIKCSMIGFAVETRDVKVRSGQDVVLDFALTLEVIKGEEIIIESKADRNSEAILLKDRKEATAVSDAVSAEIIARTGAGDAATAMERVTGATVLDGKYVFVRGLGGRYSLTQLNGTVLPSADPDKKAVQMDIIPSNLLANIVTSKTATPDKPGSFAGGAVNMTTISYPDDLMLSFTSSFSYNPLANMNDRFLKYKGGKSDWLATDDGTRAIPEELRGENSIVPEHVFAWIDDEKAADLDRYSKAFVPVMAPYTGQTGLNQSYSLSFANKYKIMGRTAGLISSLSWDRSFKNYENGIRANYQLTGNSGTTSTLNADYLLKDQKSSDDVSLSGLAKLSMQPARGHDLSLEYMYNRNGLSSARYLSGTFPRDLAPDAIYETRVLKYTERSLSAIQLSGKHTGSGAGVQIDWNMSRSSALQNEPDLRYFTNDYVALPGADGSVDTLYSISNEIYPFPTRYYRNLRENSSTAQFNISVPLKFSGMERSLFKTGGSWRSRQRGFRERRFEIRQDRAAYSGDPESFFARENMGLVNPEDLNRPGLNYFNNYIVDASVPRGNYDGEETISAAYAMVDFSFTGALRLIGGVRYEITDMTVISGDSTLENGRIYERDWLPSVNLQYAFDQTKQLRFAYSRTLARPQLRELAPYATFEFINDFIFIGNPTLQRTLIANYDIRYEHYGAPGELYAFSAFYKNLSNPIERALDPRAAASNPEINPRNVSRGRVYGIEVEGRKKLGQLLPILRHVKVSSNLALIFSQVDIAEDELELIRAVNPDAPAARPLAGQADYVLNLSIAYDNIETGTVIGLYFNRVGERLSEVTSGGTPDIYLQPQNTLNLTLSWNLARNLTLKLSGKNLLDTVYEKAHRFKGEKYVMQSYRKGRIWTFSMKYHL